MHNIDTFAGAVARRRDLAARGFEDGRWSYAMLLAAEEMAAERDMPVEDEAWCDLLEGLDGPLSDAVIQACAPVSYQTG